MQEGVLDYIENLTVDFANLRFRSSIIRFMFSMVPLLRSSSFGQRICFECDPV